MCTAKGNPFKLFERIVTISDAQSRAPRTSSRSRKNVDFDLCFDNELGFTKDRTINRLTEINSSEYLDQLAEMTTEKRVQTRRDEYNNDHVVSGRLSELKTTIDVGLLHRATLLENIGKQYEQWSDLVRKEKSIYHTLNMLSIDVTKKYLVA